MHVTAVGPFQIARIADRPNDHGGHIRVVNMIDGDGGEFEFMALSSTDEVRRLAAMWPLHPRCYANIGGHIIRDHDTIRAWIAYGALPALKELEA